MKLSKNNIIFIINPSQWYGHMYPSGILCLSAYLSANGFDNLILDSAISTLTIKDHIDREKKIVRKIKSLRPKIVCFSTTHRQFDEVVRMNKEVKKNNKNIITIIGGSQPTYRAKDFLDNGFDFVGIGEGEITLLEFVKEIIFGTHQWQKVDGLAWKAKGQYKFNRPRKLMTETEINCIPIPPYHKIDKRYFDINGGTIRGLPIKSALLLTTRGCPYSCSYCGCNLIFGKKLRFKSLTNIEAEVKYLKEKFAIEGIWIVDDTFTINPNHIIGVSKIFKKYNLIWGCQSRVNTINEKLIKIMKDSGCAQLDFGIESGSQRILDDIIGKQINIKQVIDAFSLARKYHIRTLANFIIGLPTEDYADLKKTENLADKIKADIYQFSIATPLPGTRLYDMVKEEISPNEYTLLDFGGSSLTEKLNKSKLVNLIDIRKKLQFKYDTQTIAKGIFSVENFKFFFSRGNKYQRLKFTFSHLGKFLFKF